MMSVFIVFFLLHSPFDLYFKYTIENEPFVAGRSDKRNNTTKKKKQKF